MAGHARERSPGRWELRAYAGRDQRGKPRYATRTVSAAGKREAQRLADAFAVEVNRSPLVEGSATFGAVFDEWVAVKGELWSPGTLKETLGMERRYLSDLRTIPVHRLRTVDIDRLYGRLRASGGAKGDPLSVATVARTHVVVHAAIEQARKWGLVTTNVATDADPGTVEEHESDPLTIAQLRCLMAEAVAIGRDFAVFVVLAAVTGARRGALCALRWSDLDLEAGVVRFPRVLSIGPGGYVERQASRTKRSAKRAALDPMTVAVLLSHRQWMEERAKPFGIIVGPSAFVFSHEPAGDKPWRPDTTATRRWARARARAGVLDPTISAADPRLHDLRGFMATYLLSGGEDGQPLADPGTVAARGGWSNPDTMWKRYAKTLDPAERRAAAVIGELVHRTDAG